MTKKEIFVSVLVLIVLIGGVIGGYVVWNHYDTWKKAQNNTEVANQVTTQNSDSSASSLSVDTSANNSNPAQLGSGLLKSNTSNSSTSTQNNTENFTQYDKYKDGQAALFADIQPGTGSEATAGKKVSITYKGWLTTGVLFDQSKTDASGNTQPFSFTLGARQVITGMEQGVLGMKVGGIRRIVIPPAAGYGAQAVSTIPPNSVLVFDVQLVGVE